MILIVGSLLMISLILIIVFCTYGCYRSLESRRASLSTCSLRLYHALINALIVDLVLCSVLTVLPCFFSMLLFWFQCPLASTLCVWAITIASLHSVVSHLVCLLYIRPYRNACGRFVRRLTRTAIVRDSTVLYK